MLETILNQLEIQEKSQIVYIHLIRHGSMSARLISQDTGLPRPTTYDALHNLIEVGLVVSRSEDGKSIYSASDPNVLELLIDQRIQNLSTTKKALKTTIPLLKKETESKEPRISFFAGSAGVKKILNDLLWHKDIETYTLWPMNEMIDLLGADYLEWLNKRRVERNIRLKSIRKHGTKISFITYPYLANKKENLRELRYAPKNLAFEMSYWIYADKVTFISTGAHPFGFIVHSDIFAKLQKAHFELLWEKSEPHAK